MRYTILLLTMSACVFSRGRDSQPKQHSNPAAPQPTPAEPQAPSGGATTLCAACQSNTECGDNALCLAFDATSDEGFCGRGCNADTDCPGGFECRAAGASRQCVPVARTCDGLTVVPQCEHDSDCTTGLECRNGACSMAPPRACAVSADCGDGTCVDGFCRNACAGSNDCTANEVCDRGLCSPYPATECRSSSNCGDGYSCVDGRCLAACVETADCIANEVCGPAQVCERFTEATCGECRSDQRCDAGLCRLICTDATDCPNGWACDDRIKFCERDLTSAYCVNDAQCPAGTTCTTNACL